MTELLCLRSKRTKYKSKNQHAAQDYTSLWFCVEKELLMHFIKKPFKSSSSYHNPCPSRWQGCAQVQHIRIHRETCFLHCWKTTCGGEELNVGMVLFQKKEIEWARWFNLPVTLQLQQGAAIHWAARWQTFRQTPETVTESFCHTERSTLPRWQLLCLCVCRMFTWVYLLKSSEQCSWVPTHWNKSIYEAEGGTGVCVSPDSLTDYCTARVLFLQNKYKKGVTSLKQSHHNKRHDSL